MTQAPAVILREQALELSGAAAVPLPAEPAETAGAEGRVLSEDLAAACDLPPFDRSLRDGYAVRSADTRRNPVELRMAGTLAAGDRPAASPLAPGDCWRIMTGAPLPPGADAVVMQEEAEERGPAAVVVRGPVESGRHVGRAGGEIRRGDVLAPAGSRLDPVALGLALATGSTRVSVHLRPRVSLLATGSELVAPHEIPGAGRIRGSNPWMLASAVRRAGAETHRIGISSDREEELERRVREALEADLLIVSGGTGRGQADRTAKILGACGVEILYRGVAIDPGRPALGGRRDRTLVFGLPGTPLAAWVLWRVLVSPCLRRLSGETAWRPRLGRARLASPLESARGRESWVPVDLSWAGPERVARPRASGGAGALRQHAGEPGLARVPPAVGRRMAAGVEVEVLEPGA